MTDSAPSPAQFCKDATLAIAEPIAGTASYAQHWIFVTWPKACWQEKALQSKGFPPAVSSWLAQQNASHGKTTIRLASKSETTREAVDIFIYPEGQHYAHVAPEDIETVLQSHYAGAPDTRYLQSPLTRTQFFMCTHGRHDKCCARFGQAVFQRFREEIATHSWDIDLWESSHLGGHRFAATGIAFPAGHHYGRLTPDDVSKMGSYLSKRDVYAPNYRGACYLSALEQTAEAYVHQLGFNQGQVCGVESVTTIPIHENQSQCIVEWLPESGPEGEASSSTQATQSKLEMVLSLQEFRGPKSCVQLEHSEFQSRMRWIVDSHTVLE